MNKYQITTKKKITILIKYYKNNKMLNKLIKLYKNYKIIIQMNKYNTKIQLKKNKITLNKNKIFNKTLT